MKKTKKIRVAVVAPPFGDTGGPEVVVQNLTDALVERGDVDVTLFAPADWKTKAKHIPTLEKSLWNMKDFKNQTTAVRSNLIISSQVKILSYQDGFDIVHLHSQKNAYAVAKNLKIPCVLSFHNKITRSVFNQIKETDTITVSLSKTQKKDFSTSSSVWNGVPVKKKGYCLEKGKYLISVGRLTDQKGIDVAIKIAKKTNKKLLIFGRIGNSKERQTYFNKKIKPFLDGKRIIYKGEVANEKIYNYLKNAEALLFPIRRPEVFGMVAAESLASGTPVIGTKIDPLPKIISQNKKIGFLSNNIQELVKSVKNIEQFDRQECRKYAEKYFDSSIMADKYVTLYKKTIRKHRNKKIGKASL